MTEQQRDGRTDEQQPEEENMDVTNDADVDAEAEPLSEVEDAPEAPVPAVITEPVVPRGMTDEQAEQIRGEAEALVQTLLEATGSSELETLDEVTSVGMQTQRDAAGQLDSLKTRVGDFLRGGGSGKDIANGLLDLRRALDQLNPNAAGGRKLWDRVAPKIPFLSGAPGPVRTLQRIALRYEPISVHIASIETRLREGRGMLVRDNVELRKLYEQVEAQQTLVQRAVYFGELLMLYVDRQMRDTEDTAKRDRLQEALLDVTMRVQDLRTMEEVHFQYFVSIEMTRANNNRLGQAVERTLTLATNVVTVGLAIQSAMIRQQSVMDATERTREFLGDVVTANAVAIKRHTEEIGDLYKNPAIAFDKISQAHTDLVEALENASRLRAEAIESAGENIARLAQLSDDIQAKVGGLPPEPAALGEPATSDASEASETKAP